MLSKALAAGKLPFLKRLADENFYKLHTLYTGMPSSTPSVLGELFYGVKQIVNGFAFRD